MISLPFPFNKIHSLFFIYIYRDGGDYLWIALTVNIDLDLIRYGHPIPYKYVILPQHEVDVIYELLLCSKQIANRALIVPTCDCQPKGTLII